jgi:hypothetical protein
VRGSSNIKQVVHALQWPEEIREVLAASQAASRESTLLEAQMKRQRQQMQQQQQERKSPVPTDEVSTPMDSIGSPSKKDAEAQRQLVTLRLRLALGKVCECMLRARQQLLGRAMRKWTVGIVAAASSPAKSLLSSGKHAAEEARGGEQHQEEDALRHRVAQLEQELAAARSGEQQSASLKRKGEAVRQCVRHLASATKRRTLWRWKAVSGKHGTAHFIYLH